MLKFFISAILFIFSQKAFACSCATSTLLQNWKEQEYILVAKVSEIETVREGKFDILEKGLEKAPLEIITTYKGSPYAVTHLEAAHTPICCDCSTKLSKGKYLIFSNKAGSVPISHCSNTQLLELMPYHEEVLLHLKNNIPTKRYTGIYNYRDDTFLVENEVAVKQVHEFFYDFKSEKSYVDIKAYQLNNGDLFFVKANSVISLDSSKNDL